MFVRDKKGYSLVETLCALAIIAILMALYLPTLSKAMRKAKDVAGKEAIRQKNIGNLADNVNEARPVTKPFPGRDEARRAFRQTLDIGKGDSMIISELLWVVKNDQEFEAYYYTLLDPSNATPLQIGPGGLLTATSPGGTYYLPLAEKYTGEPMPIAWEFISTNLLDTSSGSLGGEVMFSDGHVERIRYPAAFPMTDTVARLSRQFMETLP